jgi:hypothetical protein
MDVKRTVWTLDPLQKMKPYVPSILESSHVVIVVTRASSDVNNVCKYVVKIGLHLYGARSSMTGKGRHTSLSLNARKPSCKSPEVCRGDLVSDRCDETLIGPELGPDSRRLTSSLVKWSDRDQRVWVWVTFATIVKAIAKYPKSNSSYPN